MKQLEYFADHSFDAEGCRIVDRGLQDFQHETMFRETSPLNFFVRNESVVIGGILGVVVSQRLNVAALWVDKAHRRQDIGQTLLEKLEQAGRDAGCSHALVDTMDFQAPEFYKKMGYAEIARLNNVYENDRIFLRKDL